MVNNNFTSAIIFIVLSSLSTISSTIQVNAKERSANLRLRMMDDHDDQQQDTRLRKLLYGGGLLSNALFASDTVTECEEVMEGNPPVCIKVCVEVTSITSGETLVEETSKVSQSKCEFPEHDVEEEEEEEEEETIGTGLPTAYPTYLSAEQSGISQLLDDNHDGTVSSSAIMDWIGDGYTPSSSSVVDQPLETSAKSSKGGSVSSSKSGKFSFSAKSFKGTNIGSSKMSTVRGAGKSSKSGESVSTFLHSWTGSVQSSTDDSSSGGSSSSSSKANKGGGARGKGGDAGNGAVSSGLTGSAKTTASDAIIISSKSFKSSNNSKHIDTDVLDGNYGWYGSAQTIVGDDTNSMKSNKSGVITVGEIGGSSKSSKSNESNGWYGSTPINLHSTVTTGSRKSSKYAQSPTSTTKNRSDSKETTISVIRSKEGKGGGDGDSGNASVKHMAAVKSQSNNRRWQSDGWQ